MQYSQFELPIDYKAIGIEHAGAMPTVTTYIMDQYPEYQNPKNRPLVIVCPGGGYAHHSPREGEAIAVRLNSLGFNVLVLRYSLMPNEFPCALYELAWTVDYARKNAADWDSDLDKIIVAGFSAGGHVAASLGTMWKDELVKDFANKVLGVTCEDIKPNGMLLGYPVITSGEFAHRGSFEKLLGSQYDELLDKVSLENAVNADTPKTFMWHTCEDASVPLENSMFFASALRKNGIPFEYHVFPKGSHGLGLATKETDTKDGKKYQPECACWIDMFKVWVENNI